MVKFIQSSFEELFANRRYMFSFYLVGTVVLGSIAASVESTKMNSSSAIWLIVFLAIPLHFVLYASRILPIWFIEKSRPHELALYQSVPTLEKVSPRLILELLTVSIFMLASIIALLLALLSGGELASSRDESRKEV